MAEGDSIHRLARRLVARHGGATLTRTDFRIAAMANVDLCGFVLEDVKPIGKHLLMRFSGPQSVTLHSHLRMAGAWTSSRIGRRLPDNICVLLDFDDGQRLIATGTPTIDLVPTNNEDTVVGHLGPDILSDDFDVIDASRRFETCADVPIIQAMLDQRIVCGMGNLWVVETCFLRGVNPWSPTSSVDVKRLLKRARQMMLYSLNIHSGMVTTGNTRKGETHWVYGRYKRPCRRCGTPIEFRQGGSGPYDRETWWCPHCQPVIN